MLLAPMWGYVSDSALAPGLARLSAKAKAEGSPGGAVCPIQTHRQARPWQAMHLNELQWTGTSVPPPAGSLLSLSPKRPHRARGARPSTES